MERKIGEIGVDSGLCWIGDPCYVLHKKKLPTTLGKNWNEFCDLLHADGSFQHKAFGYQAGHDGLGVCVATGYGDGAYPVYAVINEEGRVTSVRIDFVEEEEQGPLCHYCGAECDDEFCEECLEDE